MEGSLKTGLLITGSLNFGSLISGRLNRGSFNLGNLNRGSFNLGSLTAGNFNLGRLNRGNFNPGQLWLWKNKLRFLNPWEILLPAFLILVLLNLETVKPEALISEVLTGEAGLQAFLRPEI